MPICLAPSCPNGWLKANKLWMAVSVIKLLYRYCVYVLVCEYMTECDCVSEGVEVEQVTDFMDFYCAAVMKLMAFYVYSRTSILFSNQPFGSAWS